MHQQAMATVKIPVDMGILPLVEILAKIPGVLTIDSCESGADGLAYIAFRIYGATLEQEAGFAQALSEKIGETVPDLPVSIALSWFGGGRSPMLRLSIKPQHLSRLASALEQIAPRLSTPTVGVGVRVAGVA